MEKITLFINANIRWLSPVLFGLTTLTAVILGLDDPIAIKDNDPIRYWFVSNAINISFWSFFVFLVISVFVQFIEYKSRKTLPELEVKLAEYEEVSETIHNNIKELFDGFLMNVSVSKLGFTPDERITLYIHNGKETFIPFGRASLNTEYRKKGRPFYPDRQGCISEGWKNGWDFYDFQMDPSENINGYANEQYQQYGIQKGITKKLKMLPRQIGAFRIGNKHNPVGIIVVESIKPQKFIAADLKGKLEEQDEYLTHMILTLDKYISAPSKASQIEDM